MEIICLKEYLKQALFILSRISSKNTTLPVLSSVYFKADKSLLTLKATNLEIGVSVDVRGSILKKGNVAVSGQILTNAIEGIDEKKITIKKKGQGIQIKTKKCNTQIKGIETTDFPLIPQVKTGLFLKIKASLLAQAFSQVVSSMAISNMRPDLAGVFIKKTGKTVKFVATDGFRLSEKTVFQTGVRDSKKEENENKDQDKTNSIIVPGKTAQEIVRIFNKKNEIAELLVEESQMAVKSANIYLVSRVVDGNYPDYTQIIPKEYKTRIILNKNELLNASKLAALFSDSESSDIFFEASPEKKSVKISAQSKNTGQVSKEIKAKIQGNKVKVVLNHRYLIDGVNNINRDDLEISINQASLPILIKGFNKKQTQDYLYLISPIKQQ